jgi:uncharacterized protein (DUF433 family)
MTQLATITWDDTTQEAVQKWDEIPNLATLEASHDTGSHPALTRVLRISRKPSVFGGLYVIGGTRIPAYWVFDMFTELGGAEAVREQYPHLELDDIFAAISFSLCNPELVSADRESNRLSAEFDSDL